MNGKLVRVSCLSLRAQKVLILDNAKISCKSIAIDHFYASTSSSKLSFAATQRMG
jgi:hypothetical protein